MPVWRARAFHLSRNRAFLGRTAAAILGLGVLAAIITHFLREGTRQTAADNVSWPAGGSPFEEQTREGYRRLLSQHEPSPAALASWIRETAACWRREHAMASYGFDALALRLGTQELHPLIARHVKDNDQRDLFANFARCLFLPDGEGWQAAWHALESAAAGEGAPRFAHEFRGDILMLKGHPSDALNAWLAETRHEDATRARRLALETALSLEDKHVLRTLCSDPRVLREASPLALWHAARLTNDKPLLWRALWALQWRQWMQTAAVPLALLTAIIWYVILIYSGSRERLRWWRYLPALFAGVVSVWLLHWWRGTLRYPDPGDAPTVGQEVVHWILYVGVPEEVAKLCLFAVFLPVLLHHRSDAKAALTAGCVGLGFALDENLHYFMNYGPQVATGRLLTANFMHVALTGIVGWHLYELFRSRFHHATEFLIAFAGAAAAHGIYDFSAGAFAAAWGVDVVGIIILAVSTRLYLRHLELPRDQPAGMTISRTAVFCIGTAILVAMLMNVSVWQMASLQGITETLRDALGLALVALLYVREFREV